MKKVKKAVIPAAGYGSRMLPASKAVPKELFPVAGKPVIQHIVEEAVAAGIEEILIIISEGKEAIKSHFNPNEDLEKRLKEKQKVTLLNEVQAISSMAKIDFIYQDEQKGLGNAVLLSKEWVGSDDFLIMLGDTIIYPIAETKRLIDTFSALVGSFVMVREVPKADVYKYGIMDGEYIKSLEIHAVNNWVEKPDIDNAPSNLAVAGRYILSHTIFDYLEETGIGKDGEIQLTDAMQAQVKYEECFAQVLNGKRYDIGQWKDFLEANNELSEF